MIVQLLPMRTSTALFTCAFTVESMLKTYNLVNWAHPFGKTDHFQNEQSLCKEAPELSHGPGLCRSTSSDGVQFFHAEVVMVGTRLAASMSSLRVDVD